MRIAALVLLVLLGATAWWWTRPNPEAPGQTANDEPDDTPPATANLPEGDWAGSESCRECHPTITGRWEKTAHKKSLHNFADGGAAREFAGDEFTARNIDHTLGPGATMHCEGPGGEMRSFKVDMIIGVRRVQMFTTNFSRGRIQVLPVFLEVPNKRWFDYTDFIFGTPPDFDVPPDTYYSWYGPHRNFNSRCGRCHITNYEIGYDPDEASYDTKWLERSIACESCHGPAADHVRHWKRDGEGEDSIVHPAKLPVERANQACGFCHAEGLMVDPRFKPGDVLFDYVDVAGLEDTTHLHPDGRAQELIHALIPSMQSRCGPMSCTKCHDPHGSGIPGDIFRPLTDDATCTQCHEEIGKQIESHTHHAATSAGSRCVACHMPQLVIEGGHGKVFDHTISIPSIENTRAFGLPNACRTCHVLEFPGFEYEPFEKWYPGADKRNHRVALAKTLAAGREQRPEAKERLVELLTNRNPVYRAGAAFLLARYDVDLRPQLADPHPMVRRAAIPGVARLHHEALAPLLDGESTVLRRAAALALATKWSRREFDFIAQQPELRRRCRDVLEQCVALRPDHAELHRVLAGLYALDGDATKAARARSRHEKLVKPD